jgi:hypothetical protein
MINNSNKGNISPNNIKMLLLLLLLYNIYIAHYITITLSASHYKNHKNHKRHQLISSKGKYKNKIYISRHRYTTV